MPEQSAMMQLISWMDENKSHCTYGTIRGKATELLEVESKQILTEEQAALIVRRWKSVGQNVMVYENYLDGIPKCRTALESFNTLLNSQSIAKGRWVILERIN